jgi:hypothetical protein
VALRSVQGWVFNRTIAYRDKRKLSVSCAFFIAPLQPATSRSAAAAWRLLL